MGSIIPELVFLLHKLTGSDHHLYFFFAFLKKNTMTGSSANFLSPKPNGQGCPLRPAESGQLIIFQSFRSILSEFYWLSTSQPQRKKTEA